MADDQDPPEGPETGPLARLRYMNNPNHDKYKRSKKHEFRIADALGGKRLPNSGGKMRSQYSKVGKVSNISFRGEKIEKESFKNITLDGDVASKKMHLEHKRTVKDSITFKKEWWLKVADGAQANDTMPVIVLTFEELNRPGHPPLDLAVVPFAVLQRWAQSK